jgi:hypothetical protein
MEQDEYTGTGALAGSAGGALDSGHGQTGRMRRVADAGSEAVTGRRGDGSRRPPSRRATAETARPRRPSRARSRHHAPPPCTC